MPDLKELLGEELHNQVIEKLGDKNKVAIVSDGSWLPKAKFDEVNDAKKQLEAARSQLETDIKDRDKQLADLKKNVGDNEDLKKQIETLQSENKQKDTDYQNKLKDISK